MGDSLTLPQLDGMETHYGIQVSCIGEDGALIVIGHHERRRAIAALNRYSRKVIGLVNLVDDRRADYADAEGGLRAHWAVLLKHCEEAAEPGHTADPEQDDFCYRCREMAEALWWIDYSAAETDPGAFPVMIWEL